MLTNDKAKIDEARSNINKLLTLLDMLENNELTSISLGKSLNLSPMQMSRELSRAFALYFKDDIKKVSNIGINNLIKNIERPSEKILKDILNLKDKYYIFPEYDEDIFWSKIKSFVNEKEYIILTKYYGYCNNDQVEGLNFEEIGKEYDVSRANINQIHKRALNRLRSASFINTVFNKEIAHNIA